MRENSKQIIQRIGETDQLYLQGNTPQLALDRAELRIQLVLLSNSRQEQIHFLQEAVVLLEQGRIEFEEMPMRLYMGLSLHLAKAYMLYFEITKEQRFALITQQILKPITHDQYGDIYFFLAYASAAKSETALTRHWLTKYSKTADFDLILVQQHPAFHSFREHTWFVNLVKRKLH
ncbi:hypothetical protein [Acinetobacter sp. BSP-28]|uniref:hypothetical protein n=1 Tax=Acinetobacter sp. BSP-28 TaxID=3344661 RepID=UPI00376FEA11